MSPEKRKTEQQNTGKTNQQCNCKEFRNVVNMFTHKQTGHW